MYKKRRIFFFQCFPHIVWKSIYSEYYSYLIKRNKTKPLEENLYFKIPKKTFEKIHCIEKIHYINRYYDRERKTLSNNWNDNLTEYRIFTRKQIMKKHFFKCQERDFFMSYKDKWFIIFSSCPLVFSFIFISQPGKVQKVWRLWTEGVLRQEVKNCWNIMKVLF